MFIIFRISSLGFSIFPLWTIDHGLFKSLNLFLSHISHPTSPILQFVVCTPILVERHLFVIWSIGILDLFRISNLGFSIFSLWTIDYRPWTICPPLISFLNYTMYP